MRKRLLFLVVPFLFIFFSFSTSVLAYSSVVAYGDSLTDDGTSATDPFGIMRFTDGEVWVETLADSMGSDLYDVAYGGATTGWDNPAINQPITGLQWQIDTTLLPFSAVLDMDTTLFTVWAGANDFLQMRSYVDAADNIGTALNTLYTEGATDILVGNLPDMGATPAMIASGMDGAATGWTLGFNASLASVLMNFEDLHPDANLFRLDAYGIFSAYTPGTPEWEDLFWIDGFHPSSVGHQLIYETAAAAIPEPTTMLLLGVGLIGLAGTRRKMKF